MMQWRQPSSSSAARWNSRTSGPLPTAKASLQIETGIIQELEALTRKLDLGEPTYKIGGGTSSGKGYFCSVHVHVHQAGSLDEFATPEQAKCAAASNAVKVLKTYYAEKLAADHCSASTALPSSGTGDKSQNVAAVVDFKDNIDQGTNGDDFERVAENLLALLADTPRGIFSHALSVKYLDAYKQKLPLDWLIRIKESYPEFAVDEVDAFRSIVAKRRVRSSPKAEPDSSIGKPVTGSTPVISPAETQSSAVTATGCGNQRKQTHQAAPDLSQPSESSKKEDAKGVFSDKAAVLQAHKVRFSDKIDQKLFESDPGEIYHEIIQPPPLVHPPLFTIPDESTHWNIFVSVVKTPADFMFRILGEEHSELYEQLQRDMQEFYEIDEKGEKLNSSPKLESLLSNVYAARAEDCWHRVYLNEIIPADEGIADEGVMASVYFVDHGDYETIPLDDLRKLEQKFMRLPCQAAPGCLYGFEKLGDGDLTTAMIDRFRELTLAKILAVQFMKTAEAVGVSHSNAVPAYLLLLAMPLENPASEEATETEGETPAESKIAAAINFTALVNDVIIQMAPQKVKDKFSSRQLQAVTANVQNV